MRAVAVTTASRRRGVERDVDLHRLEREGVAERDDLGGPLGGLDPGQARDRERVALGEPPGGERLERRRLPIATAPRATATRRVTPLLADVDHSRAAPGVDVEDAPPQARPPPAAAGACRGDGFSFAHALSRSAAYCSSVLRFAKAFPEGSSARHADSSSISAPTSSASPCSESSPAAMRRRASGQDRPAPDRGERLEPSRPRAGTTRRGVASRDSARRSLG